MGTKYSFWALSNNEILTIITINNNVRNCENSKIYLNYVKFICRFSHCTIACLLEHEDEKKRSQKHNQRRKIKYTLCFRTFPIHCGSMRIWNGMINLVADLRMRSWGDRHLYYHIFYYDYEKHQRRFIFIIVLLCSWFSWQMQTRMEKGIHKNLYTNTDKSGEISTPAHRIVCTK